MKNLLNAFFGYFKQAPEWFSSGGLIFSSLLIIYLSVLILLRFIKKSESPFVRLQSSIFIASCISLMFLVSYTVYNTYYNSSIYKQHLQAVVIILIISHLGVMIKTMQNINKAIKSDIIKLIGISHGPKIQLEKLNIAITKFRQIKVFVLVVLLPFIILLIKPKETYLYSIVFDNSASMENQLLYAKDALKEVVSNLNNNSSFVVSNVPICNNDKSCIALAEKAKRNLKDIINVNDTGNLLSSTNVFEKKDEFFSFINSGGIEITGAGSPIYECIWQNFIESVKLNEKHSFTKKKLIILTDGNDNLYSKEDGNLAPLNCITDYSYKAFSMSEFYDDLSFISYGDAYNLNMFKSCNSINLLNGYDYSSFKSSFYEQLEDIFFDKQFLWIIAIILILGITIIFINK